MLCNELPVEVGITQTSGALHLLARRQSIIDAWSFTAGFEICVVLSDDMMSSGAFDELVRREDGREIFGYTRLRKDHLDLRGLPLKHFLLV